MDILHISTLHPWHDARIFHRQCRGLKAQGFDVALLVNGVPKQLDLPFPIFDLNLGSSRWVKLLFGGLKSFFFVQRHRPRCVHLHDPELLPLALVCRLIGVQVIFDVHENLPLQFQVKQWFGMRMPGLMRKIALLWCWVLPKVAHRIVVASDELLSLFKGDDKVYCVRNHPDPKDFPPTSLERTDYGQPLKLVYAGSLTLERGIGTLLDVCEELSGKVQLHLWGPVHGKALMERLDAYGHEGENGGASIQYHGVCEPQKVPPFLVGMDVGMVPFQALPTYVSSVSAIKVFEYLMAGLLVLAPDHSGWRERWAEEDLVHHADMDNVERLKATILDLHADRQWNTLRDSSAKRAREHWDWKHQLQELVVCYEEMGLVSGQS
jgi:glycosyltransferase involved in cell wall biosynthesis